MAGFARTDLLVVDDWGLPKLNKKQQRDFLEIIEDRCGIHSTVMTSQVPVSRWHEVIDDPTLADFAAAMDGGHRKTRSASRSERIAKYNRLLEIEEELGQSGLFYWKW